MDALGTYLELINTVAVESALISVNEAGKGALALSKTVDRVILTAGDGKLEGLVIEELEAGLDEVILPTKADPSVGVVALVKRVVVKISPAFYKRLAKVVKEPLAARADELVDRVLVENLRVAVRLSVTKGDKPAQVLDVDVQQEKVTVFCGERVCVTVSDVALTLQGFELSNKNKKAALADSLLVIHGLRVEVEEHFLNRAVDVGKAKAPDQLQELKFELPGRKMVVHANLKLGVSVSCRVDLRLEAQRNLFGIYFDKFYVPGTGFALPGFARNAVLGAVRMVEKKLKGLVEVTDEYLLINPWPKIPVPVECRVERFEVAGGKVVVAFGAVPGFTKKPEPRAPAEAAPKDEPEPPAPMLPPGPPAG